MIGANIHLNLAKIIFSVIFIMLPSSTITRSMISSNAFNESTSTLNGKHLVVSGISVMFDTRLILYKAYVFSCYKILFSTDLNFSKSYSRLLGLT